MQQASAGAAADRRHDGAGAVIGVGHQAVGVSCIDQPPLDFRAVELAAGNKLMQAEACEVEGVVAPAGGDLG